MLVERDIDIRKEMESLQNEFSIDILFVRASKYVRCTCYNALHQTGNPVCPVCMGTGHVSNMVKVNAIYRPSTSPFRDNMKITELGSASITNATFTVKYDILPQSKDHILLAGWDMSNGYPMEIQQVFEVVSAKPIRGDNGRTEYYNIIAKSRPEMLQAAQHNLSLLNISARQTLAEGKRYIWPLQQAVTI